MKTALMSALILIAILTSAQARLGETLEQCIARYGEAQKKQDVDDSPGISTYRFEKNGLKIIAVFMDGRCAHFECSKANNGTFTNEELWAMLDANKGSSQWIAGRESADLGMKTWKLADGSADAMKMDRLPLAITPIMFVSTKAYGEMRERHDKEQKNRVLKTF